MRISHNVSIIWPLSWLDLCKDIDTPHEAMLKSSDLQVLGRNLEALVTKAQEYKEQWKDQYVSTEHLVLAFLDDARFGQRILQSEGLTHSKLTEAIKEIRGNNLVTDKVGLLPKGSEGSYTTLNLTGLVHKGLFMQHIHPCLQFSSDAWA